MADIVSKNLYHLLGNDSDEDSDKEPEPPTKVVDKPLPRSAKRNAPDVPHGGNSERTTEGNQGRRGGRRGDHNGSDNAFNDRAAGSVNNRGKPTDDGLREDRHSDRVGGGRDQGGYKGRGDRGGRGGRYGRGGDRHSRGLPHEHVKQADQSWGAPTGTSEWDDEKAGETIAKEEAKDGWDVTVEPPVDAEGKQPPADGWDNPETPAAAPEKAAEPATEPEPEDHNKSYAEYLAELAEKKLKLGTPIPEARKPNEGSKQDKKWNAAKPLSKDDEEDSYIQGKGEKAKRERQRKEKNKIDVDMRYVEPSRGGDRGRGGRGRGDYRGGDRGRGGRGRGGDGYRGRGRGGGGAVNVSDTSAFPSLGAAPTASASNDAGDKW